MRFLLSATSLIALISWAFFAYILFLIPPKIDGELIVSNLVYLLLSGFIATSFSAGTILYLLSFILSSKPKIADAANSSLNRYLNAFRRGVLLSTLLLGFALLNLAGFLNLLNGVLLIGTVILIELYFSSR